MPDPDAKVIEMTTEIVSAYVASNQVEPGQLSDIIRMVYSSLTTAGELPTPAEEVVAKPTAAQIKRSITPDALISFVDGKSYKTLKRHLSTHGLTLNDYKAQFGLPNDYPSTAPSYSEQRSAMAKALGLGARRGTSSSLPTPKSRSRTKAVADPE